MSDAYEHLVDLFVAIIIMFLFPLLYFGQKQESLIQTVVSSETDSLVGSIRSNGYLTKEMYDGYLEELSKTGLFYDVSIEQKQSVHRPDYRFRTADEVKESQDAAYTGTNVYTYREVTTDIPVVSDPVNNGSLNTETNESILASAAGTPASPTHVHTDACYNGTKHVHTGSSSTGGGCYGSYSAGYTCGSSSFTFVRTDYHLLDFACPSCGTSVIGSYIEDIYKCGNGHSTSIMTRWAWQCPNCGDSFTRSTDQPPTSCSYVYPGTYSLSCGKIAGHYYNGNTEAFPICSQIVTAITATNPVQTVAVGDPLITTVTAIYQDGSTNVVPGTSTFSTASIVQNQTVIIKYTYTINGTAYTKSCTITVTVIPRSKTCINGHTFNLNADGTDPGCPYCRSWLQSLTIVYPTTGSISIFKGTTLPDNGVELLATYLDGHTQHLFNEYVDNLDMQYVGLQIVTISYKGKYVTLSVTTNRNLTECSVCHRLYELYPDGTDPGCPFCQALSPIFTGNVMNYYNKNFTESILKKLYEGKGIYYFNDRDYITFNVNSKSVSWGQKLLSFFIGGINDSSIQSVCGGYVRENGVTH